MTLALPFARDKVEAPAPSSFNGKESSVPGRHNLGHAAERGYVEPNGTLHSRHSSGEKEVLDAQREFLAGGLFEKGVRHSVGNCISPPYPFFLL